jgi:hypothetical protein
MRTIKIIAVLLCIAILISIPATSDQLISPPQNYKHWQKLEKVCEEGRKTYGVNEFVENGKVCRWTFVPYWPEKK